MGEAQWDGVYGRASEALERLLNILCCCRSQCEDDTVLWSSCYLCAEVQECFDLCDQVNASLKLSLLVCLPLSSAPEKQSCAQPFPCTAQIPPCYFDSPD